jgi:hypothetical protein
MRSLPLAVSMGKRGTRTLPSCSASNTPDVHVQMKSRVVL